MNFGFSLSDIIELAFRHKFKILIMPLLCLIGTVLILLYFPRTYRSEAKIFLQIGRESLGVDPAAKTGGPLGGLMLNDRDEEVKSAIQVIGSRGVFGLVVDRMGPEFVLNAGKNAEDEESAETIGGRIKGAVRYVTGTLKRLDPIDAREEAIIELEESIKVEAERNSTVVQITLDSKSADAAQEILRALVDVYRSEHVRIHRNPNSGHFLADQTERLYQQWVDAKDKVAETKARLGLVTVAGRRTALEAQLQSVEVARLENVQQLTSVEARMEQLSDQLQTIPARETSSKKSVPNDGADLMRQDFYTNQMRLMDLRARYTPDNPQLIAMERQVEESRKVLAKEKDRREETVDDINPIHRDLMTELKHLETSVSGLRATRDKLETQRQDILEMVDRFNRNEIEVDRLEQSESIARKKYTEYNDNLEESRMNEALEDKKISSVSVTQEPTLARKPVSPSKLLVCAGGLFFALSSVVSWIFVSEKLNDRLRSETELANVTGLPVLASIFENASNKRILAR